jgi:hypothetical protein
MILRAETKFDTNTKQQAIFVFLELVVWGEKPGLNLVLYVVASKCSRNHFISEKYKILQLFTLPFLQNSPIVQLYNSASHCKYV